MLSDGTYDVVVVDADGDAEGVVHVEVAILAGERKGEVVSITTTGLRGSEFDLIGMPATLTVTDGAPTVRIDH